mgnify:CR=1 FL=1
MIDIFFTNKLKNILLLANKNLSFDKNLIGDFDLEHNLITQKDKKYTYIGCQILNKSILNNEKIANFSITKIWFNLIKDKKLNGSMKGKFDFKVNVRNARNVKCVWDRQRIQTEERGRDCHK